MNHLFCMVLFAFFFFFYFWSNLNTENNNKNEKKKPQTKQQTEKNKTPHKGRFVSVEVSGRVPRRMKKREKKSCWKKRGKEMFIDDMKIVTKLFLSQLVFRFFFFVLEFWIRIFLN